MNNLCACDDPNHVVKDGVCHGSPTKGTTHEILLNQAIDKAKITVNLPLHQRTCERCGQKIDYTALIPCGCEAKDPRDNRCESPLHKKCDVCGGFHKCFCSASPAKGTCERFEKKGDHIVVGGKIVCHDVCQKCHRACHAGEEHNCACPSCSPTPTSACEPMMKTSEVHHDCFCLRPKKILEELCSPTPTSAEDWEARSGWNMKRADEAITGIIVEANDLTGSTGKTARFLAEWFLNELRAERERVLDKVMVGEKPEPEKPVGIDGAILVLMIAEWNACVAELKRRRGGLSADRDKR